MSVLAAVVIGLAVAAAYVVYQLVTAKKAVTVASVVAQAKTDAKTEVKKV